MACEVFFYHLERTGLDQALPDLLEKTLAKGWRAVVRAPGRDRIEHLDGWLWTYRDDSFLPHGVEGEDHAERQPILLTTQAEAPNGAQVLFLIDDAEPGDLEGFTRCVVPFDGRDEAALAAARARWRALRDAGCDCAYWRQSESGSWTRAG